MDIVRGAWRSYLASSFAAICNRGVRGYSAKTYMRELASAIPGLPPSMAPVEALQRRMQQLALQDRGGLAGHNFILAVRCRENLPLLQA